MEAPGSQPTRALSHAGTAVVHMLPGNDAMARERTWSYDLDATPHVFTIGVGADNLKLDWDLGDIENESGIMLPAAGSNRAASLLPLLPLLALALLCLSGSPTQCRRV